MRRAQRRTQASSVSFAAPVKGLYEAQPVGAPDPLGAEFLQNFLPTEQGLKVRGGISKAALVDDPVKSLIPFVDATAPGFFAATANAIYDISSLNPNTTAGQVASGLTSGKWSFQQMGVSGGDYLTAVNGSDYAQIYDGGDWNPIVGEAINDLAYDGLTADFTVGETVTGGTSGASATVYGVVRTSATAGTLKLGTITAGPFQDNEALTSAGGAAVADGANSSASALTITGVDTSTLSHVWIYQNFMFFVEKDTLKAWYLPSASVGGAASSISLAGIFRSGGALLLGATWSLDSGDGLDDKCVFISTKGEVAVYSGTDPSSSSTWALEGRYDIGKPLGKRAIMQAGGDLIVATDDGIVPLSAAIQKDPAALSLSAVTRPIQKTWRTEGGLFSEDVEIHKWTDEVLLLTLFPGATKMLTANLQTGAWAEQTGWFAECGGLYLGGAYVGRTDGYIYKLNDTGSDDGAAFTARVCFSFSDLGDSAAYKVASMARASWLAATTFSYRMSVATDYQVDFSAAPNAAADDTDALVWNSGNWDEQVWGDDTDASRSGQVDLWRSVSGAGYALAPIVQIASGGNQKTQVELVSVDLLASGGGRAA